MNNFFDIMSDILLKKSGGTLCDDPDFNKLFSSYMLARYLSMRDELIVYAMIINKYQTVLEPVQIYQWSYTNIPKQKSGYISYIKKPKSKKER